MFLFFQMLCAAALSQNPASSDGYILARGSRGSSFTFTYDYRSLDPTTDKFLKPRHKKDQVYIKVNNINRLAIDVQPTSESISIPLSSISLFDSLLTSISSAKVTDAVKTVDGVPPATRTVLNRNRKKGQPQYLSVPNDDPYLNEKKRVAILQENINNLYPSLVSDLRQLDYFSRYSKNVPIIIGAECCSQDQLKTDLVSEPYLSLFYPGINTFKNLKSVMNTVPVATVLDLKDKEKQLAEMREEAINVLSEIKRKCKQNKTQDQDICDLDKLEDNFPDDLQSALEKAAKVSVVQVSDAVTAVTNLLNRVDNPQNFVFLSKAFLAEGDEMRIKVTFKPKPDFAALHNEDSIRKVLPVKGKFEWAIGPALNFHVTKSLFNYTYHIDSFYSKTSGEAIEDTFHISENAQRNNYIPSIGIMAHFYWQNHAAITPGISVGLSTSPTNLNDLKAYLGGSLMMGGLQDKLIFSAGLAGGSVDRLKSSLIVGDNPKSRVPFVGEKLPASDDLVEKVFKIGVYFGFTYKINN